MPSFTHKFDSTTNPLLRGIKNSSYLTIGNVLSQIVGLVGMIVLARVFGPEQYGIYVIVIAYVTFFHLFVLTGLSKVIIREAIKKGDGLRELLESTIGFRLLMILVSVTICNSLTIFTNYDSYIKTMILLFSIELFHFGMDSYIQSIYQTLEKMQHMALFNLATRFCITTVSIIGVYLGGSVAAILALNLGARFLVLVVNFNFSKRFVRFSLNLDIARIYPLIRPIVLFSVIQFVNILAVKIDILMISFLSGPRDAGIYNIANEVAREGLVVRNLIATAFLPVAVKWIVDKKIHFKKILHIGILLFFAMLVLSGIAAIFAENLVVLIFGGKYVESGGLLKLILFYLPFAFFSLPFTTLLQASGNESALVVVVVIGALLNIPLNIILFNLYGLIGIAISTLIVFSSRAVIVTYMTLRRLKAQKILMPKV